MSSIDTRHAAAAREARRRHLQQRQTVIFGSLIAGLLVIGLAAGAMWAGILPTPIDIPIKSSDEDEAAPPPCPPPDTPPVPFNEISANVYNATDRSGLAAGTAAGLAEQGVSIAQEENAPAGYEGVARIVTGPTAVADAYTVAALFPDAEVELDGRTEDILDVTVGDSFENLLAPDAVELDTEAPLPQPEGCEPVILEEDEQGEGEDTEQEES